MKALFIYFLTLFIGFEAFSQEYEYYKEDEKTKRKEEKRAEQEKRYTAAVELIESKNFVLEAHTLSDQRGNRANVSPTLNFIIVENDQALIQIGSFSGIGYNGVGGVTAKGSISKWQLQKNDKKLSVRISFTVMTNLGSYDIHMDVSPGNYARATLSGIRPGRLIYDGQVLSTKESRVYQGQTTY